MRTHLILTAFTLLKLPPFIRFQPVQSDHPVMTVREREKERERLVIHSVQSQQTL